MIRTRTSTAIAALFLLAAAGCGADGDPAATSSNDAAPATSEDAPDTGAAETASDQTASDQSRTDQTGTARPDGEGPVVEIERSRFDTAVLEVEAGTTVVFRNLDGYAHTVTSFDDAPMAFDSGEFGEGETFEVTFDEPGEYRYFCAIHPTMRASVVVS